MNKLILFPLAFMFLLTLYSSVYGGSSSLGATEDYSHFNGITINGETSNVSTPLAGSQEFSIWDIQGAIVILIIAIAIGIVFGFNILDSGFSPESQRYIVISILFMGLWVSLTVMSKNYLFDSNMTMMLWIGLTISYVIGIGDEMVGGGGGE